MYRCLDNQVEKCSIHFRPPKYLQLGYHKVYVMRCQNEEDFFTLISYEAHYTQTKHGFTKVKMIGENQQLVTNKLVEFEKELVEASSFFFFSFFFETEGKHHQRQMN